MTEEMLRAVLDTANAKTDGKDGWSILPGGRLMTLHVAHGGVPLTVGKIDAIKIQGALVRARSSKGETFITLADVFAAGLEGGSDPTNPARKAGFLG
jgi:hypothetical protein